MDNIINNFINYLKNRLSEPLPGLEAHKVMSPRVGEEFFRNFRPEGKTSKSAVMVILVNTNNKIEVLFTLRSQKLKNHSGQISFPGGRLEPGETSLQAAIRECHEEVGIKINEENIIGRMSELYVPPSESVIQPFVAYLESKPDIIINDDEVAEAFYGDFEYLSNHESIIEEEWDFSGSRIIVPLWNIHGKTPLWGATAMMLQELIQLYHEFLSGR